MTTISTQYGTDWSMQVQSGGVERGQAAPPEARAPFGFNGDTVQISDEARDLLASKMAEYGVESPADLNKVQRDEIRQGLEAMKGLKDETAPAGAVTGEQAVDAVAPATGEASGEQQGAASSDDQGGGQPSGQAGGQSAAQAGGQAGAAGGQSTSGSSDEDDIDDLENDIEALEKEIEDLRTKAKTDAESKQEMKSKEAEKLVLEAELALLEQQAAA